MSTLEIHQFPCLDDNYGYLIHDPASGLTATIDTPEVDAINAALVEKNWSLDFIFNTHHHHDHAGGNLELKAQTQCEIIGPAADIDRIPGIDRAVGEGDTVMLGDWVFQVHDTPGHTRGHIVFHCAEAAVGFVGDTLFALGCGRLFEGTPEQMWHSLQKLLSWPDQTLIYCAHEYTEANARFALSVEPENADLVSRANEIRIARAQGVPTVPTSMALEKKTNPFLRPHSSNLQETIDLVGQNDVEVFARTRELKDNF
jgi:hydroxyacylglutathione hydrolase